MEIVGINSENIKKISDHKKEAEWIRQYRLDSYKFFNELPMPEFGPKYDLDFNKIIYYKSNDNDMKSDWNKIDKNIKTHFTSSNEYFIKHNIYPKRNKMKHILKHEKKESPYYIRMREREKLLIYETKHVWKSFHNFANRTEDENQSNNLIKYKL